MSLIGDETNELLIQTLYPNRISSLLLFLAGYFPPWFLQAGEQDKKGWGERRLRFFHSPATAVYGPFFLPWDLHACLAASTGGFFICNACLPDFLPGVVLPLSNCVRV